MLCKSNKSIIVEGTSWTSKHNGQILKQMHRPPVTNTLNELPSDGMEPLTSNLEQLDFTEFDFKSVGKEVVLDTVEVITDLHVSGLCSCMLGTLHYLLTNHSLKNDQL